MDKLVIGIDYGSSTNFVTKYDFDKKDALPVHNMGSYGSSNIFENCLYIESDTNHIIGNRGKHFSDPENFFEDIKRNITNPNWKRVVPNLGNREFSSVDIASLVFAEIKRKVEENYGGQSIDGAVITVPYTYGDKYKQLIKEASEQAGIPVINLIEEPVAAAISFGLFSDEIENGKREKVVVFDLGGGTFDVTVFAFQKSDGQNAKIEVLNTDGVKELGGKVIDQLIADKLKEKLNIENISDIAKGKEADKLQAQLLKVARELKENLSEYEEDEVYETFSINGQNVVLEEEISQDEYHGWLKDNNILGEIEKGMKKINALE